VAEVLKEEQHLRVLKIGHNPVTSAEALLPLVSIACLKSLDISGLELNSLAPIS